MTSKHHSIDDLLAKVAEGSKKRLRIENNANTLRFIEESKLEPGTQAVPNFVIFWHYRNVWKGDRHHKANKTVFFRTFGKKFPAYRHGKQRFYLLKEGVIELNDEIIKEARSYDKQFWARKEKVQSVE